MKSRSNAAAIAALLTPLPNSCKLGAQTLGLPQPERQLLRAIAIDSPKRSAVNAPETPTRLGLSRIRLI